MATPLAAMKLVDIGVNLTDPMFRGVYHNKRAHADDFAHVLQRARDSNVAGMIITGGTLHESQEALEIAKSDRSLYSTVGCHPTRCKEFLSDPDRYTNKLLEVARAGMADGKVVAVGECGLDYDRLHFCPKDVQKRFFPYHFRLSRETGLPLFLHNRASTADFVQIMQEHSSSYTKGIVHSFTGSQEELDQLLAIGDGIYIGVNGCSLKTEENLDVLKRIPLDKLLLETDAPWCEIRPTHASFAYLSPPVPKDKKPSSKSKPMTDNADSGFIRRPKEKFQMGDMVKGRNEPCTMR
ncbi:Mg-dependent DNase [Gonapodya prolifera JEL478]|uniref:Mg-dependent DNase n=1 Tax=Gonapodya prolifera (strain JEL478) TaxID=1344416 RepID=A0A139AT44_GONPJ|nr:Mg-dependent DNase [Gonapodya prolifera JEL478]|eukprot:KXS19906.1 Mg-dependent DNase [Gonapodya prolifera JEL478]